MARTAGKTQIAFDIDVQLKEKFIAEANRKGELVTVILTRFIQKYVGEKPTAVPSKPGPKKKVEQIGKIP